MSTSNNQQSINTESSKRSAILEAVSLASCDNNTTEQRVKVERLMSIVDDRVLQYVLNAYAKPYCDWKENRKIIDRETEIDSNEFLKLVGYHSNFSQFCCNCFRIPSPEDDLTILEENKQRCFDDEYTVFFIPYQML
jgi:hypothetical protein